MSKVLPVAFMIFFWNHNVISTESVNAQCMKRRGVQFLDGGRAPC